MRASATMNNIADVDQLNQQAWALRVADPHQAIDVATRALSAAENLEHQSGKAHSLYILGHCHYRVGDYEQARAHETVALALFEQLGDREGQADTLNTIGNIHSALGDHHTAFTYYLRGLAIRQALGHQQAEAASWNNIGNVHFHLGDYPSAIEAHQKSLALKETLGDRAGVAISLNNIGNVYKECGDQQNALHYYMQGLEIAQAIDHKYGQAGALGNIGAVYKDLANWQAAQQYHLRSLAIEQQIGNRHGQAESLLQLGELYLCCADLPAAPAEATIADRALSYLQRALALADELAAKELSLRSCRTLSQLYERRGDFEEALAYYQRFYMIEHALFNERLSEQTKKLQIIFQVETSKKEAELERAEAEVARLKNIELAAALANADRQRQLAEDANRFKTRLISIAAHDLRNPITGISGYAEILLLQLPDDSPLRQLLTPIQRSAKNMEHLLKSLLETSIIEDGRLSLRTKQVDLGFLARAVVELNQQHARHKAQRLHIDAAPGCVVVVDEDRMWQILENIVSNAIKFSPLGKQIWVGVTRQGQSIRCSVHDEGPGLTQDDQRRLFGQFERLSAIPTGGEATTGLGLSIVKQLVELQGGRVWAESAGHDQGSTFIVELPASPGRDTLTRSQAN
jgi:signal transduction histidine kinase